MVVVTATEEISDRNPALKFCQTGTLLLVSVLEADLSENEVNVSIEKDYIRIELARDGICNPIMEGKLLKSVNPDQCRVRMKNDSVVIKLRKVKPGRWRSILDERESADMVTIITGPEARLQPTVRLDREQMEAPIAMASRDEQPKEVIHLDNAPVATRDEPENIIQLSDAFPSAQASSSKASSGIASGHWAPIEPRDEPKKVLNLTDAARPSFQASDSQVFGTFEHLKKSLFDTFSPQSTMDEGDKEDNFDYGEEQPVFEKAALSPMLDPLAATSE